MADSKPLERLLVVEDEGHLAAGLKLNFEFEGYEVVLAATAREAIAHLASAEPFSVIVLDVMLPDLTGFELCQRIRDAGNYTPVIMLTARSSADDRVRGINAGADDYLPKPFELDELLARVRSLIRRRRWADADSTGHGDTEVCVFADVQVNFATHEVWAAGEPLKLTKLELDLLRYFVQNPGRVVDRDELLENVWKIGKGAHTRTVDNFVMRLRKYFEEDAANPQHFVSVRGVGYKFMP